MAKELSDETCPEIVNIRKEQLRLCQSKTVFLQEVLRNKEEYIQVCDVHKLDRHGAAA